MIGGFSDSSTFLSRGPLGLGPVAQGSHLDCSTEGAKWAGTTAGGLSKNQMAKKRVQELGSVNVLMLSVVVSEVSEVGGI